MAHDCDLLIIGAGPTGLYAAYYAGFRGWISVVMDALPEPGGQVTALYPEKDIFDVAGIPVVKGRALVENLVAAAAPYSPTYVLGEQALELKAPDDGPVTVTSSQGTVVTAKAVVITGGIGSFTPRALPAADGWVDRGLVYFVPRPDDHAGRDVVIVGGGDSAFDWAYSLSPGRQQRDARAPPRAVPRPRCDGRRGARPGGRHPHQHRGERHPRRRLPSARSRSPTRSPGAMTVLPAQTVVAALGFIANIGPIATWGVELAKRHIVVDTAMRTSVPGSSPQATSPPTRERCP